MKRILIVSSAFFWVLLFHAPLHGADDFSSAGKTEASKSAEDDDEPKPFYGGWTLDDKRKKSLYAASLYRPNYFLPITYNDNPNEETYIQDGREVPNNYEAKFQLSFKIKVFDNLFGKIGDLYGAYTQLSLWQIYNESAPFRETNYEPELFFKFDTNFSFLGFTSRFFLVGLNHQSNGQGGSFSRSWNRVFAEIVAEKGNFVIGLKPWYRIPESDENDNNPDIDEYLGYGRLTAAYRWKRNVFSFLFTNNLSFDENRSGIELGWSFALKENLRLYLQYFNGYGETLIDYDNFTNRIGFGILINDWL